MSFVHRFGSSLNEHVHFHCCVIDGVFQPEQGDEEAARFHEAVLTDADVQSVQVRVRQRVLRWFIRQGYLDKDEAKDMPIGATMVASRLMPRFGSRPITGPGSSGCCAISFRACGVVV